MEQAEKEAAKKAKDQDHADSPIVQIKPFRTEKDIEEERIQKEKKEGKRIVKPSMYLKSPYNNKMANPIEPLSEDETKLAYSLLSMQGEIL